MLAVGPTEVQWHAKARENAGAKFYIVGRDPAGMAHPVKALDKDMFLAYHGRQVLKMAPGLEKIEIVDFKFAAYDTKKVSDRPGNPLGAMNFFDPARNDDFTKISGSKMRKFARDGVTPPDGYMCPTGWEVRGEPRATTGWLVLIFKLVGKRNTDMPDLPNASAPHTRAGEGDRGSTRGRGRERCE